MTEFDEDGDPIIRVHAERMTDEERKRWVAYFDDIDRREVEMERLNQEDEDARD